MIDQDPTKVHIECDHCSETTEEYDPEEFERMILDAKEAGWKIRPSDKGYTHTCPACVEDRVAAQRRLLGL